MKIENCGIVALGKLKEIQKVSAYSLIQMAKENGINLLIYHVDNKDLMRVPRPVILHSDNHFVYIKNGEALPTYKYTGFVLSEKGFKGARIVAYSEAKQIVGSKKGGVARFIVPAVLSLIPAVGPVLAAASNVGMDQYAKSNHPEQLGQPGNILDIATSAATGYLGAKAFQGGIQGFNSAAPGASLGDKFIAAGKGALSGPTGNYLDPLKPSTYSAGLSGISSNAANAANPAKLAGSLGPQGNALQSGATNLSNIYSASNLASGPTSIVNAASSPFSLKNIGSGVDSLLSGVGKNTAAQLAIGGITSQIGKPDTSYLDNPTQTLGNDYSALKSYVGNNPLPQASQDELLKYAHTPIDQLTSQFSINSDPVIKQINKSFDLQVAQVQRQFAQGGQNFANSSDAQQAIQRVNADRADQISKAQAEIQDATLGRAIQTKQFALAQGLQQGQFDSTTAMELAKLAGQDKQLKLAIDTNNYNQFQSIIANILYMGYQKNQPIV